MITIEQATAQAAGEIALLNTFVQQKHARAFPAIFKPASHSPEVVDFFAKLLDDPANYFFLASVNNASAGYIWARVENRNASPLIYASNFLYIHHISVHEEFRNKQIGSLLVDKVIELGKSSNIKTIALDTWSFNADAQRFFERCGFDVYNLHMWQHF